MVAGRLLGRFEETFERLIEGSVGRVFRSPVQPAEIARKLERAMVRDQMVSIRGRIVPNSYIVEMNPDDLVAYLSFLPALSQQMVDWLGEVAADRGYVTIGPITVEIEGAENVGRHSVNVYAYRVEAEAPSAATAQQTEVFRPQRQAGSSIGTVALVVVAGELAGFEQVIRKSTSTVGRALENDIVLSSSDVSRLHARLDAWGAGFRVIDLGSRNGTWVNGRRIQGEAFAQPGDAIAFGGVLAELVSVPEYGR